MRKPASALAIVASLLGNAAAGASPAISSSAPAVSGPQPAQASSTVLIPRDTVIRLMVMREVTTKTAHAGDRFPLRVDQDVVVGGVTVIPVGASAWGEVITTARSGIVGKSGKLAVRLLYVATPGGNIDIRGDIKEAGPGGAGTTVAATILLAIAGAGPLGLLARGTNAKLKAGDILVAQIAEPPSP